MRAASAWTLRGWIDGDHTIDETHPQLAARSMKQVVLGV
jgi:hypothetical protein